jgi:hypothetical protein
MQILGVVWKNFEKIRRVRKKSETGKEAVGIFFRLLKTETETHIMRTVQCNDLNFLPHNNTT